VQVESGVTLDTNDSYRAMLISNANVIRIKFKFQLKLIYVFLAKIN